MFDTPGSAKSGLGFESLGLARISRATRLWGSMRPRVGGKCGPGSVQDQLPVLGATQWWDPPADRRPRLVRPTGVVPCPSLDIRTGIS